MTTVLDTSVRMCGVTLHASNELTKSRIFIEPHFTKELHKC